MTPVKEIVDAVYEYGPGKIKDVRVKAAIESILDHVVEPAFWVAPASSSGKYHPSYQNLTSGLALHTVELLMFAPRFCDAFPEMHLPSFDYNLDIVLASLCIHDSLKNGRPWGSRTHKNHARLAADMWLQVSTAYGLTGPIQTLVFDAVLLHGGRWTPGGLPNDNFPSIHGQIVHSLDMHGSDSIINNWLVLVDKVRNVN